MCELFGISSRFATNVRLSLRTFARRGGADAAHADGWGVAFHETKDVRLFREPAPASDSTYMKLLSEHDIRSRIVLSHVRLATRGSKALRNTQPFCRELGGTVHTFAHNGKLALTTAELRRSCRRPVGETDSEIAFCMLLDRLEGAWENGRPTLKARLDVVSKFAEDIRAQGVANFLYSDGELLFAHAHRRTQPGNDVRPPGLHLLYRTCGYDDHDCAQIDAEGVEIRNVSHAPQEVALLASVALTDEAWVPLAEGELLALKAGRVLPFEQ